MKKFTIILATLLFSICTMAQRGGGTTHSNQGTGPAMDRVAVYPNPAEKEINVSLNEKDEFVIKNEIKVVHYTIINDKGQEVASRAVASSMTEMIDVNELPAGDYLIYIELNQIIKDSEINNGEGYNTIVKRFIKK